MQWLGDPVRGMPGASVDLDLYETCSLAALLGGLTLETRSRWAPAGAGNPGDRITVLVYKNSMKIAWRSETAIYGTLLGPRDIFAGFRACAESGKLAGLGDAMFLEHVRIAACRMLHTQSQRPSVPNP